MQGDKGELAWVSLLSPLLIRKKVQSYPVQKKETNFKKPPNFSFLCSFFALVNQFMTCLHLGLTSRVSWNEQKSFPCASAMPKWDKEDTVSLCNDPRNQASATQGLLAGSCGYSKKRIAGLFATCLLASAIHCFVGLWFSPGPQELKHHSSLIFSLDGPLACLHNDWWLEEKQQ